MNIGPDVIIEPTRLGPFSERAVITLIHKHKMHTVRSGNEPYIITIICPSENGRSFNMRSSVGPDALIGQHIKM